LARRISVSLDLDARKYMESAAAVELTTKAADKQMKSLGNQADETGRDMIEFGVTAKVAAHEVSGLGNEATKASLQLEGLDNRIRAAKLSAGQLAVEFAKTGDISVKKDLANAERMLRELEKTRRSVLAYAGTDVLARSTALTAAGVADVAGNAFIDGIKNAAKSRPLITAVVGGVAVLAPAIGGIISGAVLGAVGAGGMIGGIASAIKDPRVKSAFQQFQGDLSLAFFRGDAFVKPIEDSLQILSQGFANLHLDKVFALAAPHLTTFTEGIVELVENAMPGFTAVMEQAGPAIEIAKDGLAEIGTAFSDFLIDIVSSPGTLKGLEDGFDLIAGSLEFLGSTLHWLGDFYSLLKDIGATKLIGALFKGAGFILEGFDKNIFTPLDEAVQFLKKYDPGTSLNPADAIHHIDRGGGQLAMITPDVENATTRATGATNGLSAAMNEAYHQAALERQGLKDLNTALDETRTASLDAWGSQIQVAQGFADLTQRVKDGERGWDLNTQKGRDNQSMIKDQISALEQQRQAAIANSDGTVKAIAAINAKYDTEIAKVQALAVQLGATKVQADNLAKTYTIKFNVILGGSLSALDLLNPHSRTQTLTVGHAAGTSYAPPGTYLAGEHGPELITAAYPTRVWNHQDTVSERWRGSSGGGGGAVQLVVSTAPGADSKLLDGVMQYLRFRVDTQYAGSAQNALSRRG
jgi:hypothetical protein